MATSAPTRVPSARPTTAVKSRGRRPVRLARLALGGMAWAVFLFSCGVRGGWAILAALPIVMLGRTPAGLVLVIAAVALAVPGGLYWVLIRFVTRKVIVR